LHYLACTWVSFHECPFLYFRQTDTHLSRSFISQILSLSFTHPHLKKSFWCARFGYLYFSHFSTMKQNWVQESIQAWLWHHFHLVLDGDRTPQPSDLEPSALLLDHSFRFTHPSFTYLHRDWHKQTTNARKYETIACRLCTIIISHNTGKLKIGCRFFSFYVNSCIH